jgi:hypothetical protein
MSNTNGQTNGPAQVPAIPKPPINMGGQVQALVPKSFDEMQRVANIITKSSMVPARYKDKFEDAVVAIMYGAEVGMTPLASLRSIAVINGTPALYGDGPLALVQASGQLADIEEKIEGEDSDAPVAVCTVKRKGRASPTTRTFSRVDAQKAGLWAKQGPWTQYPKRMLQMRARAFALRDAFPDVLSGMGIGEEVEDYQTLEAGSDGTYAPSQPRPTRAEVRQQAQPVQQPEPASPPAKPATDDVEAWLISPESFPTIDAFEKEWQRQLNEVCTSPEDIDALVAANDPRLSAWSTDRSLVSRVGALTMDADEARDRLKGAA